MKPAKQRAKLQAALEEQTHVRIEREPSVRGLMAGFVVAIGAKWVLLQETRDGGYFDGYLAIRIADVTKVRRDTSFEGAFARTQPDWPPVAPDGLDLDSTKRVIRTLSAAYPLLSVAQEGDAPDCQWIGSMVGFRKGWLGLHEVKPSARWYRHPASLRISAITKLAVGDAYQTALASIAGDSPPVED